MYSDFDILVCLNKLTIALVNDTSETLKRGVGEYLLGDYVMSRDNGTYEPIKYNEKYQYEHEKRPEIKLQFNSYYFKGSYWTVRFFRQFEVSFV